MGIVLFGCLGWVGQQFKQWAEALLADQVAFMPPSAWDGKTVARYAFLNAHTP